MVCSQGQYIILPPFFICLRLTTVNPQLIFHVELPSFLYLVSSSATATRSPKLNSYDVSKSSASFDMTCSDDLKLASHSEFCYVYSRNAKGLSPNCQPSTTLAHVIIQTHHTLQSARLAPLRLSSGNTE
jgi:hypothetical protein